MGWETTLLFVLHGLLGGFTAVLLKAYSWRYLRTWSAIRGYVLGAIAGYVYWWMHSEYNLPNAVVTFIVGYFAKDFIESLTEKVKSVLLKK